MNFLVGILAVFSLAAQEEFPMEDLMVVAGGEVFIIDNDEVIHVQDAWFYEMDGISIVVDGDGVPAAATTYVSGDTDLDGSVSGPDFTSLASNFGHTS